MEPLVTVVASCFQNKYSLLQMVCNLKLQTRQDFLVEIFHDGYNDEIREFILPFLSDNMVWNEVDGPNGRGNFTGRNLILDKVTTPYVMFASDDNYYVNKAFEFIIPNLENNSCDMLIFKCLHNVMNYDYDAFKCNGYPAIGCIDMCQFVVKTNFVRSVGKFKNFNGILNDKPYPQRGTQGTEDGDLVLSMLEKHKMRVAQMNNCLLVHN